jgi:hypothetical protein
MTKWAYLFEADVTLRNLERAWKRSKDIGDLHTYLAYLLRVDNKGVFKCVSPPRSVKAWQRIAGMFQAELFGADDHDATDVRELAIGDRWIQLVFPSSELRQLFFQASDCVSPQISMGVMRSRDRARHYPIEVQLGRAIRYG